MKKESLKQILYVIIAVALVSFIIGAIAHFSFFDAYNNGFINDNDYLKSALSPYFITCLIFTIFTAILLISLLFISCIKNQKLKKVLLYTTLGCILTFSLLSIIISRVAFNACLYWDTWNEQFGLYGGEYLTYYELNLANVLNVSLSAIILVVAIVAVMFIDKKENLATEGQNKAIEETPAIQTEVKDANQEQAKIDTTEKIAPKKKTRKTNKTEE